MGVVSVQSEQEGDRTGGAGKVILEDPLQMDHFTSADLRMDPQSFGLEPPGLLKRHSPFLPSPSLHWVGSQTNSSGRQAKLLLSEHPHVPGPVPGISNS